MRQTSAIHCRSLILQVFLMSETILPAIASASQETAIVAALGKRSVVLVGMMGAGKSTIGRRMATRLRLPFVDADNEIEAAAGMSIPDIFEVHGEPHFRDGEARVIARLLESGPILLATGGGAFLREDTRQKIRDKAISMWLKADADVILRRVRRRENRPLLKTADPAATIARLIEARHPFYEQTDITIDSRDVPHEKIVEEGIIALHEHLFRPHAASAITEPRGDPLSSQL
jgi:shikimate kinase